MTPSRRSTASTRRSGRLVMKRLAACLVAFAAAGFATDGRAGGTSAAAQGTPDDEATSDRDGFAAAADEWGTDLAKALETAGKEKKVVLAAFVSSDGDKSGWCKKLKAEIFDTKEFQEWAKKGVVLLEVDFSREKKQSDDVKKQNKELQEKHR